MTSLVVSFLNQIKLNISKSKAVTKILFGSYTVILTDLSNAIKKLWEKISFHKHFNWQSIGQALRKVVNSMLAELGHVHLACPV